MKLNRLYIASLILSAALFAGCSEYEDTVTPGPKVSADNAAVRFSATNPAGFELDPSTDFSFTLTVLRDNETAALEVPVTVITNTENSFEVPAVLSFAAGSKTATLTVGIKSTAPTGVGLPFAVTFGEEFVNPYKVEYSSYTGVISLIKWNNLGTVQFYDSFSFYQVAEVVLEQRDDIRTLYRITSPYKEDILLDAEWEGWIGGTTQEKIYLTVDEENVVWDDFWYTNLLYQGVTGQEIKAYLPSAIDRDGDEKSVVVKDLNGNIQYFELYPSFYIDGLGGFGLNAVYLGFPGYDLAAALELPVFGE
jgi:hypothetical protein